MLGANLNSDNRIMGILYDGTNMLITIINDKTSIEYTKVPPKLIDGIPMVYYKDISDLLGYITYYNPQTNTYSYIDTASFESDRKLYNTENKSRTVPVKSENYNAIKEKLERQREEREREREERAAREKAQRQQKEKAAQDKANSVKTTQVLTKDGWVWMSQAEADAKKSSEKKVKILREGEGWIWVTEEEARQYKSDKNKTSSSTSSSATTGRYVIGSGWQTAEDFNKSNNTTSTEKHKVLREGVGWVYE